MPTLRHLLKSYDGRNVACLQEVETRFGQNTDYAGELVDILDGDNPLLVEGVSWLLKSHLEKGETLPVNLTDKLLEKATSLETWQAELHVCQSMQYLTIPEASAEPMAIWLKGLTQHRRPFLRAWALDGLAALTLQYGFLRPAVEYALGEAEQDGAASVRARARAVAKKLSNPASN